MGIGDWAQSPIPNPHVNKKNTYSQNQLNILF